MRTIVFVHADSEGLYEIGEELGLSGKALEQFTYACYEVELELEVDEMTGLAKIMKVDKRDVAQ